MLFDVEIVPYDKIKGGFPDRGEKGPGVRRLDWAGDARSGDDAVEQAWIAWKAKFGSRRPRRVLVMASPQEGVTDPITDVLETRVKTDWR
jgi:hypothetical protein